MKQLKKKGQAFTIGDMSNIGITLVVVAIIVGVGATILSSIQTTQQPSGFNTSNPGTWDLAYNTSAAGLSGVNTLASYIPTVALVAVAAVVVGIVLFFFARRARF